jgi:hypothetical protein
MVYNIDIGRGHWCVVEVTVIGNGGSTRAREGEEAPSHWILRNIIVRGPPLLTNPSLCTETCSSSGLLVISTSRIEN